MRNGLGRLFTSDDRNSEEPPEEETTQEYSIRDVKRELYKSERSLQQAQDQINEYQEEYRKYIQEGAKYPADSMNRKALAARARMAKFQAQAVGIKRLKHLRDMYLWIRKQTELSVGEILADINNDMAISEVLESNPSQFNETMESHLEELQADMRELDASMDSMGKNTDLSVPTSEEEDLMDKYASDEADDEDLEINVGKVRDHDTSSAFSAPSFDEDGEFDFSVSPST